MSYSTAQILFALIRSEVCGESVDEKIKQELTPEMMEKLYKMSVAHDMVHIVASATKKLGILGDDEISKKLQKQQMVAIFRCEGFNYELEQLTQVLEDAKIPFIPLKGSVIRPLYPEGWMRTSCDIDILVHESDLDAAASVLVEKLEYTSDTKGSHDISFFSPNRVHVELHYDLVEEGWASNSREILSQVWEHTSEREGKSYHRVMSSEMFCFYHIAHMAKHFEQGGCGIKPILDMYVLDKHLTCDAGKLEKLLEQGELLKFYKASRQLMKAWLCGAEHTELTLDMQDYILSGGVYGNMINRVSAQQVKRGGKLRYALSKIFLPYDVIKFHYPILQKHKWLLPIMEVRRWFKLVFCGGLGRSVNELKANNSRDAEQSAAMQKFLDDLGL